MANTKKASLKRKILQHKKKPQKEKNKGGVGKTKNENGGQTTAVSLRKESNRRGKGWFLIRKLQTRETQGTTCVGSKSI